MLTKSIAHNRKTTVLLAMLLMTLVSHAVLSSTGVAGISRDATKNERPNFLFILTDDQGWTNLEISMDKNRPNWASDFHKTPNIRKLAESGMRFSRGYSPAPNCSPTRYAILTGKTCARLHFTDIVGRNDNQPPAGKYKLRPIAKNTPMIRAKDKTIPELLKQIDKNYRAAHFGKWHLRGGGPKKHGFDVSDGATGNREGNVGKIVKKDPKLAFSITKRAINFIKETSQASKPFYCQVSHYAVHQKIQYRQQTFKMFKSLAKGERHFGAGYAAMTFDLDDSIGQLLDALEESGCAENTYVIYQADNGCPKHLSTSDPLKRYKPEIWEGGVRVPTFVRGPGIAKNSQCNVPVMGIDWMPTILELAEGKEARSIPATDGGSLVSLLKENGSREASINRPGEMIVHCPHYILTDDLKKNQRPSSSIYDGKYKLVAWYETNELLLFDLSTDPGETKNLANEQIEVFNKLRIRLRDYLKSVKAQLPGLDYKSAGLTEPGDDVDGDGLPDEWEIRELLTWGQKAEDDSDGDGVTNAREFELKSDPLQSD